VRQLLVAFILLLSLGCQTPRKGSHTSGPWNLDELRRTPAATWGSRTGLVQEVYYEGEPFHGKPTRIFAYLGRPTNLTTRAPAVVLVHGGGGKAFSKWAEDWACRGYVALAMDTSGNGPNGKLDDGGPDQSDQTKFRNFTPDEIKEMWTYHAVAAVIRGHSLLAPLPEVDPARISITGISWGGYLTCIVAGLDHRLKAAVPVYGCGFLGDNSYWKNTSLAQMSEPARELWLKNFDPSHYLAQVRCPILFLNGTHDFAYPLDSYQESYRLVKPQLRNVSVVMKLPHGHIWTFKEPNEFIARTLRNEKFPKLTELRFEKNRVVANSNVELKEAVLNWTMDEGPWQTREWKSIPAVISGKKISAVEPRIPGRYILMLMGVTKNGLRVSSEYTEMRVAITGTR
jgi:dienelactone hydrolase